MMPFAYHFSIDDSFDCLWRWPGNTSADIRPSGVDLLGLFDNLYLKFAAEIDVYLFLQCEIAGRVQSLADIEQQTDYFQQRPWLRFAPHALNRATPPHAQSPAEAAAFYELASEQIDRIAGPNRHSFWVRLHYFSESYELAPTLRSHGVQALLTTDKPAGSYRLPQDKAGQLRQHGMTEHANIQFVRSHVRIENLVDRSFEDSQLDSELDTLCANSSCAVILTHEYELVRPEVRDMIYRVFSWIQRRQLRSVAVPEVRSRLFSNPKVPAGAQT